jgi:hypothetical protein
VFDSNWLVCRTRSRKRGRTVHCTLPHLRALTFIGIKYDSKSNAGCTAPNTTQPFTTTSRRRACLGRTQKRLDQNQKLIDPIEAKQVHNQPSPFTAVAAFLFYAGKYAHHSLNRARSTPCATSAVN